MGKGTDPYGSLWRRTVARVKIVPHTDGKTSLPRLLQLILVGDRGDQKANVEAGALCIRAKSKRGCPKVDII